MKSRLSLAAVSLLLLLSACSRKEEPAPAPAPAAPATDAALAPGATPAPPVASAPPAGNLASEEHRVHVNNYAKTPVTVTVNNEWVGQWDGDIYMPLTMVVKGKNDLIIEAGGDPKSTLEVSIDAKRAGSWVTLFSTNVNGKPGKHAFVFGAK